MASTIQIRVDDDLKKKSDRLFKDLAREHSAKGMQKEASAVFSDMRSKYGQ